MIPALNISGVLPPFTGGSPADQAGVSPYATTMSELAARFCQTEPRATLFRGLVRLRRELIALGFQQGAQWINGSFCEDVEKTRGRAPGDIDLVTLTAPPAHLQSPQDLIDLIEANPQVFVASKAKEEFGCEAFFIDISQPAAFVVGQITYWFGLFSHQRATHMWKGLVQVPLVGDDDEAIKLIDERGFRA